MQVEPGNVQFKTNSQCIERGFTFSFFSEHIRMRLTLQVEGMDIPT